MGKSKRNKTILMFKQEVFHNLFLKKLKSRNVVLETITGRLETTIRNKASRENMPGFCLITEGLSTKMTLPCIKRRVVV